MEAWQDRYGSLAGQKRKSWQIFYNFYIFSAIFGCFLPHIPVFPPFLLVFQPFICHFCQFAEQFGRVAWHSSLAEQNLGTWPPPYRRNFWQERIEFWQDRVVGPPLKMTQLRLCWTPQWEFILYHSSTKTHNITNANVFILNYFICINGFVWNFQSNDFKEVEI